MDPFLIFLTVVITLITIVLVITGIQVILILKNINNTLKRFNNTLDTTHSFFHNLTNPLSDLQSLGDGVKTGLHVAEYIVGWVKQRKKSDSKEEE